MVCRVVPHIAHARARTGALHTRATMWGRSRDHVRDQWDFGELGSGGEDTLDVPVRVEKDEVGGISLARRPNFS